MAAAASAAQPCTYRRWSRPASSHPFHVVVSNVAGDPCINIPVLPLPPPNDFLCALGLVHSFTFLSVSVSQNLSASNQKLLLHSAWGADFLTPRPVLLTSPVSLCLLICVFFSHSPAPVPASLFPNKASLSCCPVSETASFYPFSSPCYQPPLVVSLIPPPFPRHATITPCPFDPPDSRSQRKEVS
jgi:hypothetical protein